MLLLVLYTTTHQEAPKNLQEQPFISFQILATAPGQQGI